MIDIKDNASNFEFGNGALLMSLGKVIMQSNPRNALKKVKRAIHITISVQVSMWKGNFKLFVYLLCYENILYGIFLWC